MVAATADIVQIGMNRTIVLKVGQLRKPVLLKEAVATVEEWLMAAEYIMAAGNYQVISAKEESVLLKQLPATHWMSVYCFG